jgi:hypothetical protein
MVGIVRVKDGVRFDQIAPGGFRILAAIDACAQLCGVDLVITSGTDGHTTGRHPSGEAYDLRMPAGGDAKAVIVVRTLRQILGPNFTAWVESSDLARLSDPAIAEVAYVNPAATAEHIHIQVRRGVVFPPPAAPAGPVEA